MSSSFNRNSLLALAVWLGLSTAACGAGPSEEIDALDIDSDDIEQTEQGLAKAPTCYRDADGDGWGVLPGIYTTQVICPAGTTSKHTDCNDSNPSAWSWVMCYADADGDGYGAGVAVPRCGSCPGGMAIKDGDCDDSDASIRPIPCYTDGDGDGHAGTVTYRCGSSCSALGLPRRSTDCRDTDATVYPGSCQRDSDGDGYYVVTTQACVTTCHALPSGYLPGDCNDNSFKVHPGRLEAPINSIDDDCDGSVDEAELVYFPRGNNNTDSSFRVRFELNDRTSRDLALAGQLYGTLMYRPLDDSSFTEGYYRERLPLKVYTSGAKVIAEWEANYHLSPAKTYEVRLRLFERIGTTSYFNQLTTGRAGWYYHSKLYYTVTRPRQTDPAVEHAGVRLALKALYERDYWDGHGASPSRYSASNTADWSTEFYAWVANTETTIGARTTTNSAESYFNAHSSWFNPRSYFSFSQNFVGDYMTIQTAQGPRSVMYLGHTYSPPNNELHYIGGNLGGDLGGRPSVEHSRPADASAVGRLTSSMLR